MNKSATIIYYNFLIPESKNGNGKMDKNKFMKRIKKWIKNNDMTLQQYEEDSEKLIVKVHHF